MEKHDNEAAVLWREGSHRCELWPSDVGNELRVYVSDILTYREPVLSGTGGLRQAAALLAAAQMEMSHR